VDARDLGLCCDCGSSRLFSRAFDGRDRVGEGLSPDGLAVLIARERTAASAGWPNDLERALRIEPWHRQTVMLACGHCERTTRHARIPRDGKRKRLSADLLSH